jgi:hypothetical protein
LTINATVSPTIVPPSNPASTVTSKDTNHERQAQKCRKLNLFEGATLFDQQQAAEHAEARNKTRQQGHDRQLNQQVDDSDGEGGKIVRDVVHF